MGGRWEQIYRAVSRPLTPESSLTPLSPKGDKNSQSRKKSFYFHKYSTATHTDPTFDHRRVGRCEVLTGGPSRS